MCQGGCALLLLQKWGMGEGSVQLAHVLDRLSKSTWAKPLAELALSLSQECFDNEKIMDGKMGKAEQLQHSGHRGKRPTMQCDAKPTLLYS